VEFAPQDELQEGVCRRNSSILRR